MAKNEVSRHVTITAPKMDVAKFTITGTAPYVTNKFSSEAFTQMKTTQEEGSTAKSKKKREPKDFEKCAAESMHVCKDGKMGIPASAFRKAMVSACRLVGFKMTLAKLSVFVEADDFGEDGTALVKITKSTPHYCEHYVKNQTGVCDIRPRMMLDPGWQAIVRVKFDRDQFTIEDVSNLLMRVGEQVGIGAGRNDSTSSTGMGWGSFRVEGSH